MSEIEYSEPSQNALSEGESDLSFKRLRSEHLSTVENDARGANPELAEKVPNDFCGATVTKGGIVLDAVGRVEEKGKQGGGANEYDGRLPQKEKHMVVDLLEAIDKKDQEKIKDILGNLDPGDQGTRILRAVTVELAKKDMHAAMSDDRESGTRLLQIFQGNNQDQKEVMRAGIEKTEEKRLTERERRSKGSDEGWD